MGLRSRQAGSSAARSGTEDCRLQDCCMKRLNAATKFQSVGHAKPGWTDVGGRCSHQEPIAEKPKRLRRPSPVPIEGVTSTGYELSGYTRPLCVIGRRGPRRKRGASENSREARAGGAVQVGLLCVYGDFSRGSTSLWYGNRPSA